MIWSTFSSSSHSRRALILHGILTMCCFSQLSLLTEQLHQLIRLDPFRVLPREVCLQILKGLDAISLGRAAQVSTHWRSLADDDILWKNICEQHIDKKCSKCGWGLPLLGKRRTLPSPSQSSSSLASKYDPEFPASTEGRPTKRRRGNTPDFEDRRSAGSPPTSICTPGTVTRPWKDVYCERLTIERNWRRGRYSVRTLQGHADGIMCMQFSETLAHPQYPVLITGSYDRTVRVWNMETGEEKTRMVGHTRAIRALQFDEAKLITASMDHTLRVWNWRNGACIRILEGHTEGVVCLNFDVNVLASGSVDTTVMIWNFRTGERFTLRGHRDWVNSVVLWDNPDVERRPDDSAASEFNIDPGKMLFSASDDASIRLWDLNSRTCVRQFLGHVGQVQSLRIVTLDRDASETELLAPGNEDGEHDGERQDINDEPCFGPESGLPSRAPAVTNAYTFSTEFNSYTNRADPNGAPSQKAFVYPNTGVFNKGKQKQLSRSSSPMRKKGPTQVLVSGSLDNTIKVWDIETSKSLKTLFGHIEGVWAIACDKLRLVSGSHDRTIKVSLPRILLFVFLINVDRCGLGKKVDV